MNEELKCPICGEPTNIYMGKARKDGLCRKHGMQANKGEIVQCNDCGKLCIRSGNAYIEKSRADLETEINVNNHVDSVDTLGWTYDDSKHYKILYYNNTLYRAILLDTFQVSVFVCPNRSRNATTTRDEF